MKSLQKLRLGTFLNPNLPEETIEQLKDFSITYSNISVYTNNMEQVMPILEEVQEKGYYAYSAVQELKEVNMIFSVMKVGLIFIGTIAVIIASIGIFNTMSMAVTERTQDIGIMKAIGGSPKMIKSLFLMESAYIGIIGSVIGALAAYAVSYGVNLLLPVVVKGMYGEEVGTDILLSYIPWSLTLISVGISVIVAILSGLKPAAKATRIDVLKALRRDI
ncbi:ABC transporter permease [Sutcliffiella cohnii]